MILTKAYITELPAEDSNIFKVRVPMMEDNTEGEAIFDATCVQIAGIYNTYNIGDCVYVSFEGDEITNAVILGKLMSADETPNGNGQYNTTEDLVVADRAELPENTTIGGVSVTEILQKVNAFGNLSTSIENRSGQGLGYKEVGSW